MLPLWIWTCSSEKGEMLNFCVSFFSNIVLITSGIKENLLFYLFTFTLYCGVTISFRTSGQGHPTTSTPQPKHLFPTNKHKHLNPFFPLFNSCLPTDWLMNKASYLVASLQLKTWAWGSSFDLWNCSRTFLHWLYCSKCTVPSIRRWPTLWPIDHWSPSSSRKCYLVCRSSIGKSRCRLFSSFSKRQTKDYENYSVIK